MKHHTCSVSFLVALGSVKSEAATDLSMLPFTMPVLTQMGMGSGRRSGRGNVGKDEWIRPSRKKKLINVVHCS